MLEDYRSCKDVVHRYVKKSLYLTDMQVQRKNPVSACDSNKVSNKLRCNRNPRFRLSVLPCRSIRCLLTGLENVCMTKMSLPRTFSCNCTIISPSLKAPTEALPKGICR